MMRDFNKERPQLKGHRKYNNVSVYGVVSPYNELLEQLAKASWALQHQDRKALQRLAWFLGMNGETHACEVIMAHAKEPVPYGDVSRFWDRPATRL